SFALMWQYIWWAIWGSAKGAVRWHPDLGNYDSFGPLMCIGIGTCYYYGLAVHSRKQRILAFAGSLACVFGLVSSYARGAVLAGAGVFFWLWLRSPRKGMATAVVFVGLIAVGI